MSDFLAIDFETANTSGDSACALALVKVSDGEIVHEEFHLIRPPSSHFQFTHIHGLTWEDVAGARDFGGVWEEIDRQFDDVDFVAAHNAPFDRGVLKACCDTYGLLAPSAPTCARCSWPVASGTFARQNCPMCVIF